MQKKIYIYKIITLVFIILIMSKATVLYSNTIFDYNKTPGRDIENTVTKLDTSASKVWNSILLVLQIASISGFIFAGVKYMFASADQKSEIKQSMLYLVIGSVFVFASSTIVQFIINSFSSIVKS